MSPVPGAGDLERKNTYWIDFGKREERERIIKLLEELDDEEWMGINQNFIALIKGENKSQE